MNAYVNIIKYVIILIIGIFVGVAVSVSYMSSVHQNQISKLISENDKQSHETLQSFTVGEVDSAFSREYWPDEFEEQKNVVVSADWRYVMDIPSPWSVTSGGVKDLYYAVVYDNEGKQVMSLYTPYLAKGLENYELLEQGMFDAQAGEINYKVFTDLVVYEMDSTTNEEALSIHVRYSDDDKDRYQTLEAFKDEQEMLESIIATLSN